VGGLFVSLAELVLFWVARWRCASSSAVIESALRASAESVEFGNGAKAPASKGGRDNCQSGHWRSLETWR